MITSKDNDKIKLVRKLMTDKKTRRETGLFVLEGVRLIDEAISGRVEIEAVYISESKARTTPSPFGCHPSDGGELAGNILAQNSPPSEGWHPKGDGVVLVVKDSIFDAITDTVNSQGIIALCRKISSGTGHCDTNALLLDRIRDPGNMGAIIRTAAAAGYNTVYCIDCADPYQPKSVRASMGGILYVDIIETDYSIIDKLKRQSVSIIAADMGGINVFEIGNTSSAMPQLLKFRRTQNSPLCKRGGGVADGVFCLAIGSEADGLDPRIKNSATLTVSIPMQRVESLNAAVSAGILMYFFRR
ncbi:MAG: RNA methyltransferase [Firmicutes bacterium]|nr:RNA methyltransferase [Bacillota bacterium]